MVVVVVSHGWIPPGVRSPLSTLPEGFPATFASLVFFVISGFLLTRQMIIEIEKTGTLSLKSFYLAWVFRLFPALLLYIALFTPVMIAWAAPLPLFR